jgi:hypothetical protein
MKSATDLKNLHKRIQLLKGQLQLLNEEWLVLEGKQGKSKDETKHQANVSKLKWNLIYEIRGLQLTFNELKEKVILEIIS